MGRQALRDFRGGLSYLRLGPVTGFVLACNVLTFLLNFFAQRDLFSFLVFHSSLWLGQPWTLLTWPLVGRADIVTLLLTWYVFWWAAGTLEREWGSRELAWLLVAVTLLTTGIMTTATLIPWGPVAGGSMTLLGLPLPLAAVFLAWCMSHPSATVMLMFILPIQARWLGYLDLIITYFTSGPILGVFAIATPIAAWWYAVSGRYFYRLGSNPWRRPSATRNDDARRRRSAWNAVWHPIAWLKRRKGRRDFEKMMNRWDVHDDSDQSH